LIRLACCCFALTLGTVSAQGKPEPADAKADDLKEIRTLLERIEKRLANQQTAAEVVLDIVRKDLKDLRDEVSRLQRELADARNRITSAPSTSLYGGTPSASLSVGTPSPNAFIRLVNTHFIDMSAVINGTLYTVSPGRDRTVPVNAGVVNYQVFQVPEPMKTRSLVANETLTLTLYPR
jgi:hypothetical protein